MSDFRKHLERSLQDGDFRKEWNEQQVERTIMQQIVDARIDLGITQQELAYRCGMKPSNLCRLEGGRGKPSLSTLERIAQALGKELHIDLR